MLLEKTILYYYTIIQAISHYPETYM